MREIVFMAMLLFLGCDSQPSGSSSLQTNEAAESSSLITLTDDAVAALRKFGASDQATNCLEVSVEVEDRAGCSNYRYSLSLTSRPTDPGYTFCKSNGVDIAVDVESVEYLRGTRIDWIPLIDGKEGFYFHNPNAIKDMPDYVRKYYESKASQ